MENLKFYNQLRRVPPQMLKPIKAGRQSGKSDINPQWRIEQLTSVFGVCGFGWKYTIDNKWSMPGHGGEMMVFVDISLYVKIDGEWSEPIPGTGGNTIVVSEKQGTQFYNNDDAYKMAVTDALSVAGKALGLAGDIYAGLWDGSKYRNEQPQAAQAEAKTSEPTSKPKAEPMTLERAQAMTTADGKKYGDLTRADLDRIKDNKAAPEEKKQAARLLIAQLIKEGK